MTVSRRLFVAAIGAAAASCRTAPERAKGPPVLDTARLDAQFPALATRAQPGVLGLGVGLISSEAAWTSDAVNRYPMQSVFKAPLAAAALSEVDAGRLKLNEPITITQLDLSPPASAIDASWPTPPDHHTLTLPAVDLIALAVQKSDNTAADVIMKRIGGPGMVTAWLTAKGISNMSVDRYERELQQEIAGMPPFQPAWKDEAAWTAARNAIPAPDREAANARYLADARDTATLPATLDFLNKLVMRDLLSEASTRLLLRLMTDAPTGAGRIRAALPPGASLAHKTGSARTDLGLTPATNDIGIVTLANGRRFSVAVYLAASTATEADRDRLIADAARLAISAVS
jgi:beta-lactamase class A